MNGTLPEPVRDVALLIARVLLGVVLFAHGWQKLMIYGIAQVHQQFETLGIPLAIISSSFVTFVEFVGGALLIVGALTPAICVLHMIVMIGAASFVHMSNGIFAADGGWELVGVIACCELLLATHGAGRFSVDQLVRPKINEVITRSTGRPASESLWSTKNSGAATATGTGTATTGTAKATDATPATGATQADNAAGTAADAEAETTTMALPVQARPTLPPSAPVFGEQPPGTGSFPEQSAGVRPRRIPRPVAPLQGRVHRRAESVLPDDDAEPSER